MDSRSGAQNQKIAGILSGGFTAILFRTMAFRTVVFRAMVFRAMVFTAMVFTTMVFIGQGWIISSAKAEDRLELDSISIKGSRELPKVLYIVPWKSARLGAFEPRAGSSTFDVEMEALDRDVFRRQVEYYGMLFGKDKSANNK